MMKRVCVICEGETEETFVRELLAPLFYDKGLSLIGQTVQTSLGNKGGALNYDRMKRDIERTLKQKDQPFVTTLVDLYKLDTHFPAWSEALPLHLPGQLAKLTTSWHEDIVSSTGCRPERFLPYIQPYEFEALLFSNVDGITVVNQSWQSKNQELKDIRAAVDSPEYINDKPETKPAAHLKRLLVNPNYRKIRHGRIAMQRVGLSAMVNECQFFATWIENIRKFASVKF